MTERYKRPFTKYTSAYAFLELPFPSAVWMSVYKFVWQYTVHEKSSLETLSEVCFTGDWGCVRALSWESVSNLIKPFIARQLNIVEKKNFEHARSTSAFLHPPPTLLFTSTNTHTYINKYIQHTHTQAIYLLFLRPAPQTNHKTQNKHN